jgi:hypothetical protein
LRLAAQLAKRSVRVSPDNIEVVGWVIVVMKMW